MSFSAWSKDARKRWVDAGGIVVDDGEVVEDPPLG
jgi:hypothetical protein